MGTDPDPIEGETVYALAFRDYTLRHQATMLLPMDSDVGLIDRSVVACFLRHDGKICLLKRSQAVGSARGQWHCVSGFLEPGAVPLEQAFAEIGEETGLVGDAVRLVCSPAPIRIERPSQGWVWVIHPFLFDAASPELRLDWEHEEYRWIAPADLTTSDCVSWLGLVWEAIEESFNVQRSTFNVAKPGSESRDGRPEMGDTPR